MELPELIREARKGSAAAQKGLYYRFADRMLLVCRRYVNNVQDAEELALNGFYRFFDHLPSFRYEGEAALFGWLKKIMVNECLQFLRKKTNFNIVSESYAADLPSGDDVLDNLSAVEIFQLVVQLPVGYRTVFNLYVIEGFSHAEIAAMLGITEGTSRSQLSKGKALLQNGWRKNNTDYGKRESR